jgi:hypothetical protein
MGGKVCSAQFDLWPSEWNVKPERVPEFNQLYDQYWDAHRNQIPNGGVSVPSGESTFTMNALREHIGAWLYRAAQFIYDRRNLYDIRPVFS